MTKKYLGFVAGLLLLVGCSNNDFTNNGANVPDGQKRTISTINATMDNADTRLFLDGNQVAWEDDDVIYAFSDEETTDWHEYSLSYLYPTTGVADFSGDELTGSEFYAFYPEPEVVNWSNHTATIPWDYDVIYDNEGVNTSSQIPLFAKSTNANMQFKQLGGLLHFQIYGEGQLESLSLTGNNEEKFSSAFDLDYGASEIKLVPNTSCESSATITEDFMKETEGKLPLLSKTEPFDVYIVLPAGMAFEHGFTLSGSAYVEDLDRGITRSVPFEQTTTSSFTVTRAEMANFPAISTTGILPTPEPEKGWISNYLDLSGTKVEMNCFVINSKVDWQFAFYPDNGSGEASDNVIAIEFFTDYEGGTPDLSWLIGTVIYDLEASRFHGPDGIIYRIGDSDGFKVKKNTDGTWYLSIENAKIHPNGSSINIMEDFYLKFRGNFVGEEPESAWTISGGLNFGGNEADVYAEVSSSLIYWSFTFADLDKDGNMRSNMLMGFETPYEGVTPTLSMLDNFQTTNFRAVVHDFTTETEKPNWRMEGDETMLTITNSGDVWTISFDGMAFENNDGAVSGGVNFKFEGKLTLPPQPTWSFSGDATMDD